MSTPAPKFAETPNTCIEYLLYGKPDGIPVILLHGFPDSPLAYEQVIDRLDTKKLRLIVPYLRGFGQTHVKSPDLVGGQTAALGDDLLAFADALSLPRFHLVGHDWGASSAYAAAVLAPERIQSLFTLASPYVMFGGKPYPPYQVRNHWYQWFFQLQQAEPMMNEHAEAFCHQLWRAWSPSWDFSKSDFTDAVRAWKNPQFAATVLHYYRTRWGGALSLRAYATLQARLSTDPKPKITVPTLYIQGGADACDPPESSDDQASFFTGPYDRIILKESGHFPHREDAKAVARALERHLDQHSLAS